MTMAEQTLQATEELPIPVSDNVTFPKQTPRIRRPIDTESCEPSRVVYPRPKQRLSGHSSHGKQLRQTASVSNRPRMVGKMVVETPWSGTFGEYETFEKVRVPTEAEVSWHLLEGSFTYWRGTVVEFRLLR